MATNVSALSAYIEGLTVTQGPCRSGRSRSCPGKRGSSAVRFVAATLDDPLMVLRGEAVIAAPSFEQARIAFFGDKLRNAVKRRLISFDAVEHLLLALIDKRPAHLDLTRSPHLTHSFVAATRVGGYGTRPAAGADHG